MDARGDNRRHPSGVGVRLPRHLRRQPALGPTSDDAAELVERVDTPRGELVLRRSGEHFEVISNGVFLMDTRDGRSERLLVQAALGAVPGARSMLIGGLGVGFSLRGAGSDSTPGRVDVVEVEGVVVRWHDAHLRGRTGEALADPRVRVVIDDLSHHLGTVRTAYDVVCVDIDNGPTWTVTRANAELYGDAGTQALLSAVRPGGVLA